MANPTTTQNQRTHQSGNRPVQRPGRPGQATSGASGADTELATLFRNCSDACYAAFNHSVNEGKNLIQADYLKVLLDCSDVCITGANFIARDSAYLEDFKPFCAPIIKACEEACEEFEDEALVTACADACRSLYDQIGGKGMGGKPGNVGEEE